MRHTPPPQLDYAPPPPLRHRHITRRLMQAIVAVLTLVIVVKLVPRAWNHAQILYWQHKCMTAAAPSDHIVYSMQPKVSESAPEWNHFTPFFRRLVE
jgi:hypothetical protein